MQKYATNIFIIFSVIFGILGIFNLLTNADENSITFKLLLSSVFVILPSFALSVAGKYLKTKK